MITLQISIKKVNAFPQLYGDMERQTHSKAYLLVFFSWNCFVNMQYAFLYLCRMRQTSQNDVKSFENALKTSILNKTNKRRLLDVQKSKVFNAKKYYQNSINLRKNAIKLLKTYNCGAIFIKSLLKIDCQMPYQMDGVYYDIQQIFYNMSSDLCTSLIEFGSIQMDIELELQCSSVFVTPISQSFFSLCQNQSQSTFNIEDSFSASQDEEIDLKKVQDFHDEGFSLKKVMTYKKTHQIKKIYQDDSNQLESAGLSTKSKRGRKAKANKTTYPTKNFLPNFKGPHISFLQKELGFNVNNHPFIQYLRAKDGISLKDYENLYKINEFSEAFKAMFKCRFLYRELLLSRSDPETKKIHQRKLHVFEEAFETKVFTKIN